MKHFLPLFVVLLFSGAPFKKPEPLSSPPDIARCYGYSPCTACSNCSACKHCTAGGTCGVCAKVKKKETRPEKQPPPSSGQCQATTKKGSRCSRASRSGGYCWQHGG